MKLILTGPPASNKATNRVRIKERYPLLCYANANELLRFEIQSKTPFGVQAAAKLRGGETVRDQDMMDLVLRFLKSPQCSAGFILEGMPRTAEQAEQLVRECRRIDALVEIDLPDSTVIERTSGRWVHKPSGRVYHDVFAPPKNVGRDDVTGEQLTRRLDDETQVAEERLKSYRTGLTAIKRFFQGLDPYSTATTPASEEEKMATAAAGGKVWEFASRPPMIKVVNGSGSPEEVRSRLFSTLDELVGKRAHGPTSSRWWWSFW